MSLRDDLNQGDPNRLGDVNRDVKMGEAMALLLASLTPTQSSVAVSTTAYTATLSATPTQIFQVNCTAGTVTGVKELLQGPITGEDAITPLTGQVVWNGGVTLKFAAADLVSATHVTYAVSTTKASILMKDLGE